MVKSVKYVSIGLIALLVGGYLLLGRGFFSYVRTSAGAVQESVKESVPIEFELRRARNLIEAILPELQAQVRLIAREEVEIAALEKEIDDSLARLDSEQDALAELRNKMDVQQVAYQYNGRDWTRMQLTEQLARRFDRFKQGELAVASKQKLLDKRNESLASALTALDTMRQRKMELEQKVEGLAAQARMVKAEKIESGLIVQSSDLSEAEQLLSDIETRLHVAQRVLEHEQEFFPEPLIQAPLSDQEVLSAYDAYFNDADSSRMMVTRTEK